MGMTRSYGIRPVPRNARPTPKRPVAGEYSGRVLPVGKVPIILSSRKSDIVVSVANEGKAFLYVGDENVDSGSGAIIEPGEYASFDVPRAEDLYGISDGETKVRVTEYSLTADRTGAPIVILSGQQGTSGGGGGEGGPHTHPEYIHSHPYAPEEHAHPSYEHSHPYASDTHNHSGVYAALTHEHEGGGAHDHDGSYSALAHNHDGSYAPTHSHPYASDSHNHDASYSGTGHSHDTTHNHDGVYAPTHSHPYADADHGSHPTADEKAALAGTSGAPANGNRYVTNADSRLSDARTPTAHTLVGASHTASGLTAGHVLRASGASAFGFAAIAATDLPAHASRHNAGGADAMAVDSAAGTGSLRTLGTGATQAATGNHGHSDLHARQHAVTSSADHTFPGGTTDFLRADGTFATPTAGPPDPHDHHAYASLGTATALALATNDVVDISPSATATLTTTVPSAGSRRIVLLRQTNTTAKTITFGTGFKPTTTLALGTTNNRTFAVTFVSDGTNLYETSRTAAMVT
jgi:hypothetical protein